MNKKKQKISKYETIANSTTNIEPYRSSKKEEILECLGHEDAIQIILAALGNRKDADTIFINALLKSPKFWFCMLVLSMFISGLFCYLFYCFPEKAAHAVEKSINSKIPDLLPMVL
jgi:hypothetical protein